MTLRVGWKDQSATVKLVNQEDTCRSEVDISILGLHGLQHDIGELIEAVAEPCLVFSLGEQHVNPSFEGAFGDFFLDLQRSCLQLLSAAQILKVASTVVDECGHVFLPFLSDVVLLHQALRRDF